MPRFIAINVGEGDAFFIERMGFTALIDGGRCKGFLTHLRQAASTCEVDVLVCTHNDQDHANGILEFLENGGRASECWLPAVWMEAVAKLCRSPWEETLRALLDEEQSEDEGEFPTRYLDEGEVTDVALLGLLDEINNGVALEPLVSDECVHLLFTPHGTITRLVWPWGRQSESLFGDARRILKIALAAADRQIPIRWFDPQRLPSVPPSPMLAVVNAAEVTSVRRTSHSLKKLLNLSKANQNSLVLYSAPDSDAPGVLFCSDSGLGTVPTLPVAPGMIVTAPHHGSCDQENVAVYGKVDTACGSPESLLWVRSDSTREPTRPCREYIARKQKYCTRCRGGSQPSFQDVTFLNSSGNWTTTARPCKCPQQVATPPTE